MRAVSNLFSDYFTFVYEKPIPLNQSTLHYVEDSANCFGVSITIKKCSIHFALCSFDTCTGPNMLLPILLYYYCYALSQPINFPF